MLANTDVNSWQTIGFASVCEEANAFNTIVRPQGYTQSVMCISTSQGPFGNWSGGFDHIGPSSAEGVCQVIMEWKTLKCPCPLSILA